MEVDLSSSSLAFVKAGLPIAFVIAFAHIMLKRRRRGRTRLRTAMRVMLTRHVWLHSSTLLDFQYFFASFLIFSIVFSYTLLTGVGVSHVVCAGLTRSFGPHATPDQLPIYVQAIIIFGLYMAFEFSYWIDHFLSHKIPFLWEFHKVHHSAIVLTPFASWRVHPVDTFAYGNIQAIIVGSISGLIQYFAGHAFSLTCTAIVGILLAAYMALWGHLQHSQFWLSCTGLAGRIFLSPAHHQIHHSRNPIHFDKNFGSSLAVWDWLFCTLHLPQPDNEYIRFGTEGDAHLKGFIPSVLYPFHYATKRLIAMFPKGSPATRVTDAIPIANPATCGPAVAASETLSIAGPK